MPTFSAMALDRLLEPGASKSVDKSGPNLKPPIPNSKPNANSDLERRNNTSITERTVKRPQISPALYATPEATPLPDSPSSFSPSPYIINHKRRGPRLMKSLSEDNVSSRRETVKEDEVNSNAKLPGIKSVDLSKDASVTFSIAEPNEEEHENGVHNGLINVEPANGVHDGFIKGEHINGVHDAAFRSSDVEVESSQMTNGLAMDSAVLKVGPLNSDRCGDSEDFFDPNESMSVTSNTDGDDDIGAESFARLASSRMEFFDAWDELSPETPQSVLPDVEAELRETRSGLLVEIEKRKQAEEALNKMRCKWQGISQNLAGVGLSLPADPIEVTEDELEELRQQVDLARFVSLSVGRGIVRAEMEMEMESQIESKNFEIARLLDRLHYYEAVNREMSQRNQEAIEMARRDRQRKRRRQRWVWGSIATAITLGTAALAWSYLPTEKGSSSVASLPQASDSDDAAK
ncbi:hypothetical protein PTKIN_Ptkin07bG0293800 [Pterospermum kingtungense]